MRQPQSLGQSRTQQTRLIIAPAQKPCPMQGHRRHHHIGLHQTLGHLRHPICSRAHNIMSVAMFQRQHQRPARLVIGQRRDPTTLRWVKRQTRITHRLFRGIKIAWKRQTACPTTRPTHEMNLTPTAPTQPMVTVYVATTGNTARGINNVQRGLKFPPAHSNISL